MNSVTERALQPYEPDDTVTLLPSAPSSTTWLGTASHFGLPATRRVLIHLNRTWWSAELDTPISSIAHEMRSLRDRVGELTGLSKQDVARAIGVDRRSLSGFVTGEIRPTDSRVLALRVLADVAERVAGRFGDRARDVLRCDYGRGSVLDLIATGRVDVHAEIDVAAESIGVSPKTRVLTRRRGRRDPPYLRALEQWANRVDKPEPGGTPREATVYEQRLDQAAPSGKPHYPRRKQI